MVKLIDCHNSTSAASKSHPATILMFILVIMVVFRDIFNVNFIDPNFGD